MMKPFVKSYRNLLTCGAVAAALATGAAPALAGAPLSLSLQMGQQDSVNAVRYSCTDGTELTVQYVNSGANALAVMRLAGDDLIFVNVISGSGARYVSGAREWWTKGAEATLRNETMGADAVTCTDMADAGSKG
ncbi:MliC family protein [Roseovarius dicentrarchi]|uniref:MliC family protein n=1 Tax=Roseovarius dicentrarchi TaxID=2250573 RepID=UPI000DE80142|nr:MliC family protein [Roseovarius dicentrarchi]